MFDISQQLSAYKNPGLCTLKVPLDADGRQLGYHLLFDPVTMMAIPGNSNAQRLGIGAPMIEVIRKVIEVQKIPRAPKKPPVNNPNSKGIVLK